MRDIYKNPTFYYILAPIVVALWPLLVRGVHLPNAERNWKNERNQYNKAQSTITEIF